jgi:hypothetical protein
MTDELIDQERADRDRERSEEAHWRVAEAGAEQREKPRQKPLKNDQIPLSKRDEAQRE